MPARILTLLVALLVAVVPVACGGASPDEDDVDVLLRETFTGEKEIDSGRVSWSLTVDAQGARQVQGPVTFEVAGPFESAGEGQVPSFDLDASVSGAGMTYQAGAVSTGDAGYVQFQGRDYRLPAELFDAFAAKLERAHADRDPGDRRMDLATLGIDPREWLTDPQQTGGARVGDAETIRITGGVDVPALLADLDRAAERAHELDPRGTGPRKELTERERREIVEAVRDMRVEIHTGADDRILRRLVVEAELAAAEDDARFDSADVRLDYSLTELGEPQEIEAPQDARPFEELRERVDDLGMSLHPGLGGRGAGAGDATTRQDVERYTRCLERAGEDEAAQQECLDRL